MQSLMLAEMKIMQELQRPRVNSFEICRALLTESINSKHHRAKILKIVSTEDCPPQWPVERIRNSVSQELSLKFHESTETGLRHCFLEDEPMKNFDHAYSYPTNDMICLSHLRWIFVLQRPQHLMRRYAIHRKVTTWKSRLLNQFPKLFKDYTELRMRESRHSFSSRWTLQ